MFSADTVTVIGANGTMGCNVAAIFASFGKAKVYMVSRTLGKSEKALDKACQSVKADSIRTRLFPADYSMLEQCVEDSELVFEACAEDWAVKAEVHGKIAEVLRKSKKEKIICTGTSGLSVTKLAEIYEDEYRKNVYGMHFFNPPYSMTLCELIPTVYSDDYIRREVQEYLKKKLRRSAVIVKDKPAFLANRIGFQFINKAMQMAEEYKYNGGIDYIDAIMGPFTGRAMAPLVTANFVGLDVHKAIVDNLYGCTLDYAHEDFLLPRFCQELIEDGALGRKTGAGLYKVYIKDDGNRIHQVYDIEHKKYREVRKYTFQFVETMLEYLRVGDYKAAFDELRRNRSTEAEICCCFLINYVIYALAVSVEVAEDIHAVDAAMSAGFNWCPPLAVVEAFGGKEEFMEFCRKRIGEKQLDNMKFGQLMEYYEPTEYDYRKYFRAKR